MGASAGFRFIRTIVRCTACRGTGAGITGLVLVIVVSVLIPFASVSQGAQGSQGSAHHRSAGTCDLPKPPNTLTVLATKCCTANPPTDAHCKYYSATDKYVIVKDADPQKPYGYLIMPSFPVTGIEQTTETEKPPVADFWQFGWIEATQRFLKKSPKNTALAINSKPGRQQDQLHIHFSCVLSTVPGEIAKAGKISTDPTKPTTVQLGPHKDPYEVVTLTSLTGASSPFKLIEKFPHASGHIGDQSIAIIGTGTTNPPVYYMAVTYNHGSNPGDAEELLNQTSTCGNVGHRR